MLQIGTIGGGGESRAAGEARGEEGFAAEFGGGRRTTRRKKGGEGMVGECETGQADPVCFHRFGVFSVAFPSSEGFFIFLFFHGLLGFFSIFYGL
jgi:hypothetical protein